MKTGKALEFIKDNWEKLPKRTLEGVEAVWFVSDDIAGSYEVDEEHIGMKKDGNLVWAYASGCSCWSGDYETKPVDDIKVFEFNHGDLKDKWADELIKFVEKYTPLIN